MVLDVFHMIIVCTHCKALFVVAALCCAVLQNLLLEEHFPFLVQFLL
jgi:hypothetical protein